MTERHKKTDYDLNEFEHATDHDGKPNKENLFYGDDEHEKPKENPGNQVEASLGFDDYWNIFKGIFYNHALVQLGHKAQTISLSWRKSLLIIGGILTLVLLMWLFQ